MEIEKIQRASAAQWFRDWLPLVMLCIAGLVWGMKLETDIRTANTQLLHLSVQLAHIEAQVDRGILPRAEERIVQLERRALELEAVCRKQ